MTSPFRITYDFSKFPLKASYYAKNDSSHQMPSESISYVTNNEQFAFEGRLL